MRASRLALLLGLQSAWAGCPEGGCPAEIASSSLLARKARLTKGTTELLEEEASAKGSCGPLSLPGFRPETSCQSLSAGQSCLVKCPYGKVGKPVRYFCFSSQADRKAPPAALAPPFCRSSSSEYKAGKALALEWEGHGCLSCGSRSKECEVLSDAKPGDERCTKFTVDREDKVLKCAEQNQCLDMFRGPKPGLWGCNAGDNQVWEEEDSTAYPGSKALCIESGRGKICLNQLGLPKPFFRQAPDATVVGPALEAIARGDKATFLKQAYAEQVCRARLDTDVPDEFFTWLMKQDEKVRQALFATYPVHPGQVRMLHKIWKTMGAATFDRLGMASFAVALSYVNRFKESINEAIQMPHPRFEMNDAGYLAKDKAKIAQRMKEGMHSKIQSNECRDLHKCCGSWSTWKFKWPRDPTPSVKDWLRFWQNRAYKYGKKLWNNPLKEVPWNFATYLWPSPIAECEWVQRKLLENEAMEGKWYLYDANFHTRICQGGKYHPDSLPGIAVYGGVCGRMSQLEYRKNSCMGRPATGKGEPGHAAGFRFKSTTAIFSTFTVQEEVTGLFLMSLVPEKKDFVTLDAVMGDKPFEAMVTTCLSCPAWKECETAVHGSEGCTKFEKAGDQYRTSGNQCLVVRHGGKPGLWSCSTSSEHQRSSRDGENYAIKSPRGLVKLRASKSACGKEPSSVPQCLVCAGASETCTFARPNDRKCSKFYYDAEIEAVKVQGMSSSQCVDMFSGPKVGLWRCNGSGNQKAKEKDAGKLVISSSRGELEFKKAALQEDSAKSEECLVCTKGECGFGKSGSEECTVFAYDAEKSLVSVPGGKNCLTMYPGPKPGLWGCKEGDPHMEAKQNDRGSIVFRSSRGELHLRVPKEGKLPAAQTRWEYSGFHEISCTRENCHYQSLLSLDSSQLFEKSHKEAALALFEAFNEQEHEGIHPTAFNEARLAASMALSLHKGSAKRSSELLPLVRYALKRNPALYEAWGLAAELGLLSSRGLPNRNDLPSHAWFKTLSLVRVDGATEAEQAAADGFAKEHLLERRRWLRFPQLRSALVQQLCGALSDDVLEQLDEASEQCLLLKLLAAGEAYEGVRDLLLEEDALSIGNEPSEKFLGRWEALARVAATNGNYGQTEKVSAAVSYLLKQLTVGYVNERSETFFTEHGRLLLSSPYAHVLQLAGLVLPRKARELLLETTKAVLQRPADFAERLRASPEALLEPFVHFASVKRARNSSQVFEAASSADGINGFGAEEEMSPEVLEAMKMDRDAELERGDEKLRGPGSMEDYGAESLLKALLRLNEDEDESPSLRQEAETACYEVGSRVMLKPGGRYHHQQPGVCATLEKQVCAASSWTWLTFDSGYQNWYMHHHLQACTLKCFAAQARVMLVADSRYAHQAPGVCATLDEPVCEGGSYKEMTFDNDYSNSYQYRDLDVCVQSKTTCWDANDRVMLVPGSRYAAQAPGQCATLTTRICQGGPMQSLRFDNGYSNKYAHSDLQSCGFTTPAQLLQDCMHDLMAA